MSKFKYLQVAEYDANGGPAAKKDDENGNPMDPTNPGRFVVYSIDKYVSPPGGTYPFSSGIKWGTPIKLTAGKIQIKMNGTWINLSSYGYFKQYDSPAGEKVIIDFIEGQYKNYKQKKAGEPDFLTPAERAKRIPDTWIFNDFGHITIRYYEDVNGNYKHDAGEKRMSDYIHTNPFNEFRSAHNAPFSLGGSHGCIHVRPADIDVFIKLGYIKDGSVVEVKTYTEKGPVPLSFESEKGRPEYEMHFYPGLKKIIAYSVTAL